MLVEDCFLSFEAGNLCCVEAGVALGERKREGSVILSKLDSLGFLCGVLAFFVLAMPFFVAALDGAGRFLPMTGAGVTKLSTDEAREPAIEGSVLRLATILGGGGELLSSCSSSSPSSPSSIGGGLAAAL